MYSSKKAEISTLLTLFALFTAVSGFALGSFVGNTNTQTTQAANSLKQGEKCLVNNSKCAQNLLCLPRYTQEELAKFKNPTVARVAKDEGICQLPNKASETVNSPKKSISQIADQILSLKNDTNTREIATLLETGQISSGDGTKNSPYQVNSEKQANEQEGKRFVALGGICSASFSFIKDPWVSKVSIRSVLDDPQNAIYSIDSTSQALDNSIPPESFPRLLNINGSTVKWIWNPKAPELNVASKPQKANNYLSTSLGGGQSVNHFYEASPEQYAKMTTSGELIVRLSYQTTKTDLPETVYMYQDVKVSDCKNGITPSVVPPSITANPTVTPTVFVPSSSPTPSKFPSSSPTPSVPSGSITPTNPPRTSISVTPTPFNNISITPPITQKPNLACNDLCDPKSSATNNGCPSNLVCAPENGTGIPPFAIFRCFLPNYHSVNLRCQTPPTAPPNSPTPTNPPPTFTQKACFGTINLVVDVTTTNKNNLQNIKNILIGSLEKSLQQNPSQTTTYRLFKFSKTLSSYQNGQLLSSEQVRAEIAKNCESDKTAFVCFSPNTDIASMVKGVSEHYLTSFFVEPYFVFTDGLHYYENDRQLEYSGLYYNSKLRSNRTVGADFYPYANDLQNPETDPVLATDQYGRLDANIAAKKQVTVSKTSKRTYNDAMISLVSTIHDKLGFAPKRDVEFTPLLDKSFVYNFTSKYPNIIPVATSSSSAYPGQIGEFNPEVLNILGRHTNLPSNISGGKNFATLAQDSANNVEFLSKLFTDLSSLGCIKKTPTNTPPDNKFAYQIDIGKTNGLSFTGYGTQPNVWDMCYTVADDKGAASNLNDQDYFRHSGPGVDRSGKTDSHCGSGKISDFILPNPDKSKLANLSTKYKNNSKQSMLLGIQANRCPNTSRGTDGKIHCDDALKIDDSVSQNGGYILQLDLKAGEELQVHWNNPSKNDYLTLTKNQANKYVSTCNIGVNAPAPLCQKNGKTIVLTETISTSTKQSEINLGRKNAN